MHMDKSFSQLSISQQFLKKTKMNDLSNVLNKKNNQPQEIPISFVSTLVPRYLTGSDRIFKQMLSRAVNDGEQIVQWLDTNEKLKSTRQLAQVVNMLCYLQLQQHLWQEYYNIGMTEGVWIARISKQMAKEHHTCSTYGRSQKFVEQRQKTITRQVKRTRNELQQHLVQLPE